MIRDGWWLAWIFPVRRRPRPSCRRRRPPASRRGRRPAWTSWSRSRSQPRWRCCRMTKCKCSRNLQKMNHSTGFSSEERAKFCTFPRYCLAENTQPSPIFNWKPGITHTDDWFQSRGWGPTHENKRIEAWAIGCVKSLPRSDASRNPGMTYSC